VGSIDIMDLRQPGEPSPVRRQLGPVDHTQVERVVADLADWPLTHLPSGSFRKCDLAGRRPDRAAPTACCRTLASLACARTRGATRHHDLTL
jgi:hypothetical protein